MFVNDPSAPQAECDRSQCICCLVMLVMFTALMLFMYSETIDRPEPKFRVSALNTTIPFTFNHSKAAYNLSTLSVGFNIMLRISEPSHGTLYQNGTVSVYYRDFLISSSIINSFSPGLPDYSEDVQETWVLVTVNASSVPISQDFIAFQMRSDIKRQEISLSITITGDYKWQYTKQTKLKVKCKDIKVRVPDGIMVDNLKPCKVDWHR